MSKNLLFKCFLTGSLLGICIHNISQNITFSTLLLLFGVIFFLNYYHLYKKHFFLGFFVLSSCLFGILLSKHHLDQININNTFIEKNNSTHHIEFKIKSIEKIQNSQINYKAKLLRLDGKRIEDQNIYFHFIGSKFFPVFKDKLYIQKSKIYLHKRNSSYFHYLLSQNIYFKTYNSSPQIIYEFKQNNVLNNIGETRNKLLLTIHGLFPKNEALFLGGILLGAREDLPDDLKTNFNNSGLTHFIAVSGFNITIIIIFLGFLFAYLPSSLKIILMPLGIVLFVFLVGDTAPVVRAAIMGIIGYIILISGRDVDITSLLLLSAFGMSLINPYILNYDISFQLSFLAVLGIVFFHKPLENIFFFLPKLLAIREAFVLTISAMILTIPIMLINFGQLSIIAPLANILVSWTIPIAMLFGFIGVCVDLVSHNFGVYINYLTWVFLKFDILIVNYFGSLSFSSYKIDLGIYKNIFLISYYSIILFFILYFLTNKKEQQS